MDCSMLVVCHPNQSNYRVVKTKHMVDDVQAMLDIRLLQLYKANILEVPDCIRDSPDIIWEMIPDL